MKHGFTLLEVVIATALSAIISAVLIFMLQQMNQVRSRVDRYSDMYERATLIGAQLERDLAGAFLPVEADMTQAGVADQVSTSSVPSVQSQQKSGAQQGSQKAHEGPKKLEKAFFADHKLQLLTFITDNIMQRYWSAKVAQISSPQPRAARVLYRLVPDKKQGDSFALIRQESSELYFQAMQEKNVRAYQLADGIKDVRMEYVVYVKIVPEKKQETGILPGGSVQQKQEVTFERKVVKEWQKIEEMKPPWPLVPQWVFMDMELWDVDHERTQTFHFEFQILPRFDKQEPRPAVVSTVIPTVPKPAAPLKTPRNKPIVGRQLTGTLTSASFGGPAPSGKKISFDERKHVVIGPLTFNTHEVIR